jgi:hypothetical protein
MHFFKSKNMLFLLTSTNRYTIPTIYYEVNKPSKEGKKVCVDDNAVFITAAANPSVFRQGEIRAFHMQTCISLRVLLTFKLFQMCSCSFEQIKLDTRGVGCGTAEWLAAAALRRVHVSS